MKKHLVTLLAVSVLTIGAANAAEKTPVSNWLNNVTKSVSKTETSINNSATNAKNSVKNTTNKATNSVNKATTDTKNAIKKSQDDAKNAVKAEKQKFWDKWKSAKASATKDETNLKNKVEKKKNLFKQLFSTKD